MLHLRLISRAAVALILVASSAVAQDAPASGTSFVYLNSAEILQSTPGMADAQRTFDREIAERRTELTQQAATVDSLVRDYQRQEQLLSPQAKEQKQQEIQNLQRALNTRRAEMETELGQRQLELQRPILERVSNVIEAIRAERNYTMVFDVSAEGVVAADPALDITDLVKSRLADNTTAAQP